MLNDEIMTHEEREAIFNNMTELFDEYDYEYTADAIYEIIDTWAYNKADLIRIFKHHPNYVEGKFMIAFNTDWNREIDHNGPYMFRRWLRSNVSEISANLTTAALERRAKEEEEKGCELSFMSYPATYATDFLFEDESIYSNQFVTEASCAWFNDIDPSLHFTEGMKMSRAINKICHWLGIDKLPEYNKEFAKYADSVNPLKIVRHTVISINPIDYLTMSFGNSWASCHTIDKANRRGMPNSYQGQYSSGTVSYMLDKVSMVFYTVDASYNGNDYYFEPKINRNMFHYGEDKLIQGRVYPQGNDNNADGIYKSIREIVQRVMADCLGIPNYWVTKKGASEIGDYVVTRGTHYPDYNYFNNCCISRPKGIENEKEITIGHMPICIECGCEHDNSDNINCCTSKNTCVSCGCIIDDDDVYWVDGEAYCHDCVSCCDHCGDTTRNDNLYEVHDCWGNCIMVCECCRDYHYSWCERCGEYYPSDEVYWVESEDRSVCRECYEEYYFTCSHCGEIYNWDDHNYDEVTGDNYCPDCWADIVEERKNEEENDEEAM